jgi:hypothetical protein
MTEVRLIGGCRSDAPLWNKASLEVLNGIVEALSLASFQAADEQRPGGLLMLRRAARMVNEAGLGAYAIRCLYREKPQIVGMDDFLDLIIQDARDGGDK